MRRNAIQVAALGLLLVAIALVSGVRAADPPTAPATTNDDWENNPEEQGLFEDVTKPKPETKPPAAPPPPQPPYRIFAFSTDVILDYYFYGGNNQFTLTYHIDVNDQIELPMTNQPPQLTTRVLAGNAGVNTEVEGYLAKGAGIQCLLEVQIPKLPYQVQYRETSTTAAIVNVQRLGPAAEDWSSNCLFSDDPEAVFKTSGPPEKWMDEVLAQLLEQLKIIDVSLSDTYEVTKDFRIEPQRIEDGNIGRMDIRGEGNIIIGAPQEPVPPPVAGL